MKKLLVVIFAGLWLTACGAAGVGTETGTGPGTSSAKLDVKVGAKDSTLNVKSGAVGYSGMNFSTPGKPTTKTSLHTLFIANYDLDATTPEKPLTAPDQMRVDIRLTGEEGTWADSPFKVGTYSPKADKFNVVSNVTIITFADGKQTETRFDNSFGNKKVNGEVKLTSVTAETVSGEVNLTEGDKSIKGNFTANLPKAK